MTDPHWSRESGGQWATTYRRRLEEPQPDESLPLAVRTVFGAPEMSVENILEQGDVDWDDLMIEEPLDPTTLSEEKEE